jgi:hypothetical protein
LTNTPHDSNYAAATATAQNWATVPTGGGTVVGQVRGGRIIDNSGTAAWTIVRWTFGTEPGSSAIVLRGTTQGLAINLGAVVATQSCIVTFQWTEDNS